MGFEEATTCLLMPLLHWNAAIDRSIATCVPNYFYGKIWDLHICRLIPVADFPRIAGWDSSHWWSNIMTGRCSTSSRSRTIYRGSCFRWMFRIEIQCFFSSSKFLDQCLWYLSSIFNPLINGSNLPYSAMFSFSSSISRPKIQFCSWTGILPTQRVNVICRTALPRVLMST